MSKMIFHRFGKSYHLQIRSVDDIRHLLELDEAHWVATGAPTGSINMDPQFLDYMDVDDNYRLMCFEVRSGINWLLSNLTDYSGINNSSSDLSLNAVNSETDDGKAIITASKKILRQLGSADAETISLKQVREIKAKEEKSKVNQAGIATSDSAADTEIKQFIEDIVTTIGGVPEESEKKGINEEKLKAFLTDAEARLEWHKKTVTPDGRVPRDLMPFGQSTHKAFKTYNALKVKIDQYFAQCEAVAFDHRTGNLARPSIETMKPEMMADIDTLKEFMEKSPIAEPDPHQVLRFSEPLNPYFDTLLQDFRVEVIKPLFDQHKKLSKADWLQIQDTFKVYQKWFDEKKGGNVESLGLDKLELYLTPKFKTEAEKLIAQSNKTALVLDNIKKLEQLILYQANIISFLNNFVGFPYLYDPANRAAFEMGTMIIDGRHLNFSVKVTDLKQHVKVAETSDIFIIYAEITEHNNKDKYTVAVPVTSGTKGNLCVGKRGIFRNLKGEILDAKVIKIIENPISIGETLVAPFQRLGKLITGKIEAMTTAAEKKLDNVAKTTMAAPAAAPQPQAQKGMMAGGLVMGGGVAIAAITSAVTFFVKTITTLEPIQTVLGLLVAILAVIAPATIIAMIKLRRRDLSAILEGVGWAINDRMRLTFALGRVFTVEPRLPGKAGITGPVRWWIWALLIISAIVVTLVKM